MMLPCSEPPIALFHLHSTGHHWSIQTHTHKPNPTISTSLCVSLPSHNSPQPLPSLSRQFQVCFSQLQVFVLVLFDLFVGLFGFHLICLCILFHGIFNDLFWVCVYLLIVFSFVGVAKVLGDSLVLWLGVCVRFCRSGSFCSLGWCRIVIMV